MRLPATLAGPARSAARGGEEQQEARREAAADREPQGPEPERHDGEEEQDGADRADRVGERDGAQRRDLIERIDQPRGLTVLTVGDERRRALARHGANERPVQRLDVQAQRGGAPRGAHQAEQARDAGQGGGVAELDRAREERERRAQQGETRAELEHDGEEEEARAHGSWGRCR